VAPHSQLAGQVTAPSIDSGAATSGVWLPLWEHQRSEWGNASNMKLVV